MKQFELQLLGSDFHNSEFYTNDCPIGRAIKRVTEEQHSISFDALWPKSGDNGTTFKIKATFSSYYKPDFVADQSIAEANGYDSNEVIRTIILNPRGKDSEEYYSKHFDTVMAI